jgi:hypothetical protein
MSPVLLFVSDPTRLLHGEISLCNGTSKEGGSGQVSQFWTCPLKKAKIDNGWFYLSAVTLGN